MKDEEELRSRQCPVDRGTIKEGEYHPAADSALVYIKTISPVKLMHLQEAMASCAIEGNRMGEICGETLRRLLNKEPVSDRYLLGLAWFLREMEESGIDRPKEKG